jgi:uncharacterized protein (TIGR02118 family)
MHKLVLLFGQPEDPVDFDRRWSEEFVTVIERMPGLRRVAVGRITGVAAGEAPPYLVHEFLFDTYEALMQAMASPPGQAAGRALMSLAHGRVTICFAEHHEMALPI